MGLPIGGAAVGFLLGLLAPSELVIRPAVRR
jgi:hypothetical protein